MKATSASVRTLRRKTIVATTLTIGFSLLVDPVFASGAPEPTCAPSSQQPTTSSANAADSAGTSRTNGRADWDIDYPSQLAPGATDPSLTRKRSA